jgi:hypothetical protein
MVVTLKRHYNPEQLFASFTVNKHDLVNMVYVYDCAGIPDEPIF